MAGRWFWIGATWWALPQVLSQALQAEQQRFESASAAVKSAGGTEAAVKAFRTEKRAVLAAALTVVQRRAEALAASGA